MVHRRAIEGSAAAFGNQGALWGNAMTWWDHATGSVWSQPKGEAIMGPLTGATLELLPSKLTTWRAWRDEHPHTEALDVHAWQTGFSLDDMAIVVDLGTETVAYRIPDVRSVGVINDVIAGIPMAVVFDPLDDTAWAVISRTLDDTVVDLFVEGHELVDANTGSTFDPITGVGRSGRLEDTQLDRFAAFTIFPSDFPTFFPLGTIWERDDS